MKHLITLSILLTSFYSPYLFATCDKKDKTLFFCEIQKNGKILEVCDKGIASNPLSWCKLLILKGINC